MMQFNPLLHFCLSALYSSLFCLQIVITYGLSSAGIIQTHVTRKSYSNVKDTSISDLITTFIKFNYFIFLAVVMEINQLNSLW